MLNCFFNVAFIYQEHLKSLWTFVHCTSCTSYSYASGWMLAACFSTISILASLTHTKGDTNSVCIM